MFVLLYLAKKYVQRFEIVLLSLKFFSSEESRLPEGLFSKQNPKLGYFWRDLGRLVNVDKYDGHLEYFTDIGDIL
jgi:hypothetical protein